MSGAFHPIFHFSPISDTQANFCERSVTSDGWEPLNYICLMEKGSAEVFF